jgi:hypothetical protein
MTKYIIWEEQGKWRGCLQGSPDQQVQGESFEELQLKLCQLCRGQIGDKSSTIRKIA